MDRKAWNQRYEGSELVWSAAPNVWVEQLTQDLPAGTALDIAAGEGRNSLWLASRGWHVTAADFSAVALQRARSLAEEQLGPNAGRLMTLEVNVETWVPQARSYDLVLVAYLHLPNSKRTTVMRAAAEAVAPGGTLLVVGQTWRTWPPATGDHRAPPCCIAPVTSWRTSSRHNWSSFVTRQ
jgi:2-polyprenyl-3-methyl-5-hydroxy-6-metoxy-1,4-benzoquinol methylase